MRERRIWSVISEEMGMGDDLLGMGTGQSVRRI